MCQKQKWRKLPLFHFYVIVTVVDHEGLLTIIVSTAGETFQNHCAPNRIFQVNFNPKVNLIIAPTQIQVNKFLIQN